MRISRKSSIVACACVAWLFPCHDTVADGPATSLSVDIELSSISVTPLMRCICVFATDCCGVTTESCQEVVFVNGLANDVTIETLPGEYVCAEAVDPLHTLRSIADVTFDGSNHVAQFVGDPEFGGNWLVAGNLNGDVNVNILDVGVILSQVDQGISYADGNTTCLTEPPHADVNGDGLVDTADENIIKFDHFLAAAKIGCCDDVEPIDTDGDGVIDFCDGCPTDPNKTDPGLCGCGVDDNADQDGDGVIDCFDECPGVDDGVFAPGCVGKVPTVSSWGILVLALGLFTQAKLRGRHPR